MWRNAYERAWLPTLQAELENMASSLFEFDDTLKQVRKIHMVRLLPFCGSTLAWMLIAHVPIASRLRTYAQCLHVVAQASRLFTQRGGAVEALESSNKVTRNDKMERTNQIMVQYSFQK